MILPTLFATLGLVALSIGAVLGFVHSTQSIALQPSAALWRIGTLLIAGTSVCLAFYGVLPHKLVLWLANVLLIFGMALYACAIRIFFALPTQRWPVQLALVGSIGFAGLIFADATFVIRVWFITLILLSYLIAMIRVLKKHRDPELDRSSTIMSIILQISSALLLLRMLASSFFQAEDTLSATALNFVVTFVNLLTPVVSTTAFLLMCSDRMRIEWQRAASIDALTGIANRRTLVEIGKQHFTRAALKKELFALAILDVDYFKLVNDRHGHAVGDLALQHLAEILRESCGVARVGRLGGEEFLVFLHPQNVTDALSQVEQLRERIAASPLESATTDALQLTCSIGLACYQASDQQFGSLLLRADRALYRAKAEGRNCTVWDQPNVLLP